MHGSGGPDSGPVAAGNGLLRPLGIATFSLDSFTARGVTDHASDPSQLGSLTRIYDAYRAVDVLAADPRIDPDRIAVMGFSGGIATLYGAMTRFQQSYGPERGRIVAHVAFYPLCNYEFEGELDVADVPIREFHGGADDYAPPGPCRDYIAPPRRGGPRRGHDRVPGRPARVRRPRRRRLDRPDRAHHPQLPSGRARRRAPECRDRRALLLRRRLRRIRPRRRIRRGRHGRAPRPPSRRFSGRSSPCPDRGRTYPSEASSARDGSPVTGRPALAW